MDYSKSISATRSAPEFYWNVRDYPWLVRRYANVRCNTTLGRINRRHLDSDDPEVVELHRGNLSDRDWNSWARENVIQ